MAEGWGVRPPLEEEPWVPAVVPGTVQHALGADFRGVAWYCLNTNLPEGWDAIADDERLRIRFECAATDARVWINGVLVGRHLGDFVPFEFEATEALRSRGGEVVVVVRVDQVHAPRPAKGVITEHGHIGKGFHDVLSVQHAGLWSDVELRRTGPTTIRPNGVVVRANGAYPVLEVEFDRASQDEILTFSIVNAEGRPVAGGLLELEAGTTKTRYEWVGEQGLEEPLKAWSPESPVLYTLVLDISPRSRPDVVYESHTVRFGKRSVTTGGADGRRLLLNGTPIQLRGVLHWGHEPAHIAPSPSADQIREEFRELKLRGFNCVCLCMVYMPEHYYEIADEMGMLLWQEHPVWKSAMGDELLPEYQRLYAEYFRRDRSHPSVILVSGSCEHEMFSPALADWWWHRAQDELEGTLKQVQTAFFAWADPATTDLYDEHTYDNSGRWIDYLADVRSAIDALPDPRKPFIMGETIITNTWPEIETLRAAQRGASSIADQAPAAVGNAPPAAPWWLSRGLEECAAVEASIVKRWGEPTLRRFQSQARRHTLNLRKFQCERFRLDPSNAGWVMNHIRDVPLCRCGFMDDLGRWRFEPHELRPFLSDAVLLLTTEDGEAALHGGGPARARLHLCNFSPRDQMVQIAVDIIVGGKTVVREGIELAARCGTLDSAPLSLGYIRCDRPTEVIVRASANGIPENEWRLWALPEAMHAVRPSIDPAGTVPAHIEPDFDERKYSSGWGLPCVTWRPRSNDPRQLLPEAPAWTGSPKTLEAPALTTRLSPEILAFLERGGRVLLLANKERSGLGARTVMQWGGVPLVIESSDPGFAVGRGESAAVVDLLHMDLSRYVQRMVPTGEQGLADAVEPVVRFIYTHDSGKPTIFDAAFGVGVGAGVLVATSLDHGGPAGRWLLNRLLYMASAWTPRTSIPVELLKSLVAEPLARQGNPAGQ